jgi:hypothetical protein
MDQTHARNTNKIKTTLAKFIRELLANMDLIFSILMII